MTIGRVQVLQGPPRLLTRSGNAYMFSSAMPDTNYVVQATHEGTGGVLMVSTDLTTRTTTQFEMLFRSAINVT